MQITSSILTIILFMGYLILWRIKRNEIRKSEGIDVNVIFKATRPIQQYFSSLEKIMTIAIALIILIHLFFSNQLKVTENIIHIDLKLLNLIGFLIGLSGLTICRIAQVTIGKSWRVGIDENAKPGLVKTRIYRFIRNPTYTGLFLMCAGIWIMNSTFLYSLWILAFCIMMEFQVRCEEEYLQLQYGNEYSEYCKKTKRYFPLIY
jgi:protein-S-isoprenylcysteine O-methyltransferase Ste14